MTPQWLGWVVYIGLLIYVWCFAGKFLDNLLQFFRKHPNWGGFLIITTFFVLMFEIVSLMQGHWSPWTVFAPLLRKRNWTNF